VKTINKMKKKTGSQQQVMATGNDKPELVNPAYCFADR